MSDASDWDPLPEAQRVGYPGELGPEPAPERSAGPSPEPAAPSPPVRPGPRPAAAPDPAAEAAFRALQRRCAAAPAASSLVAEVQHREQRAARRRAAAQAPFAAAAQVVQSSLRDAGDVPVVEAPVAERDPREDEDWFRRLPESERERLKAHWWRERHRGDDAGVRLRRRLGRAVGQGAMLFFVLSLLLVLLVGGLHHVPLLTVGGALAAGTADVLGGGRFRYAMAGAIAFVLVFGAAVVMQPFLLMALMLTTYAMGCLGMDGEMRRSGGFGDA